MGFTDALLVRRLKANDRAAFEQVVAQHYDSVYRQLWHLCEDRETAADLTQETFLQAWRSLPSFEGRSSLRTWLYTIAVRAWQRWSHHARRTEHDSLDELAETLSDPAPDPATQTEAHLQQQAVCDALRRLPAVYRETLILYYVQDMKYHEIATALQIPLGTVKSRLHTGLQRIKADLEADIEAEVLPCG